MKNFCKKVWALGVLCILCASFFTSCSSITSSDDDFTLPPDANHVIAYKLYPNDKAKNDSAAANLARGIMLVVHPSASYELSFEIDSTQPAPELQLFRTYDIKEDDNHVKFRKVRTLLPTVVGNRYVYSFICEENEMSIWTTSLGVNGTYYQGKVKNISFTGEGVYTDALTINLIVVGAMEKTKDGMDIDQLSSYMLDRFREKYYGITIDTLYVRYAQDHPALGSKYPANSPWVAGLNSKDLFVSELTGWPEDNLRHALNIVLVHSINDEGVMGLSRLFSGVLGAGKESSVVIGEHVKKASGVSELLSSFNIVITAIHETGHFFGLRHTSATRRDLSYWLDETTVVPGDLSNIEDGLTDTHFCEYILRDGLYKQAAIRDVVYRDTEDNMVSEDSTNFDIRACPDLNNIMFPVTVSDYGDASFSKQQMELIRSSLMIFPH